MEIRIPQPRGGFVTARGRPARDLIAYCTGMVEGLAAGTLHPKQIPIAYQCGKLLAAFALKGIEATVDEACGVLVRTSTSSDGVPAELAALRAGVADLRGLSVEVGRLRERLDASDEAARRRFASPAPTLPAGDGQPVPLPPSKPQSQRRQLQGASRRAMRGLSPSASDADATAALDEFNARVAQVYRRARRDGPGPLGLDAAAPLSRSLPVGPTLPSGRAGTDRPRPPPAPFRDAVPLCLSPPDELEPPAERPSAVAGVSTQAPRAARVQAAAGARVAG